MHLSVQLALGDLKANPFILSLCNSWEPPEEPVEPHFVIRAPAPTRPHLKHLAPSVVWRLQHKIRQPLLGFTAAHWHFSDVFLIIFDWWSGSKINEGRCIRTTGWGVALQSVQLWISNLFKSSLKCKRHPQAGYHHIFQCHLTSLRKRMSPLVIRFPPHLKV